jgi:hypothetical protein
MHRPALLTAAALAAGACASQARIVRRPATAAERNAVVECAAAIALDEGFSVTERRPDVGLVSASWPTADRTRAAARGPKGGGDLVAEPASGGDESDVLTVRIATDPVNRGLALVVRASAQAGDSVVSPSPRAAMARDRIIRSCAYLVG